MRVLGETVMFTLVYNQGGALGTNIGSSHYYTIISVILLPVIGYYIYRYRREPVYGWPLAFIAGGALGNLIDRLRLGQVVDFIDVDFFDIGFLGISRWWTFNVADAAISCGIVFLLFVTFLFRPHEPVPEGPRSEAALRPE